MFEGTSINILLLELENLWCFEGDELCVAAPLNAMCAM